MIRRRAGWVALAASAAGGTLVLGIWLARGYAWRRPPLVLSGTLQSDAVEVVAPLDGSIRLVAVREGDRVKAGQLLAWMDSPELREALRTAEERVRDVERRWEERRRRLPARLQEAYSQAEMHYSAARRALEEAKQLAQEKDVLADQLRTARLECDAAERTLREAEARWTQVSTQSAPSGTQQGDAPLESPNGLESAPSQREATSIASSSRITESLPPNEATEFAAARQDLEKARERYQASEQSVGRLKRRLEAAQKAAERLPSLEAQVRQAADALEAARWELESRPSLANRKAEEQELRREMKESQEEAARVRTRLGEVLIRAPAESRVEHVAIVAGRPVRTGQPLATLRRLDALWTDIILPYPRVRHLGRNQEVSLRAVGRGTLSFTGRVLSLEPTEGVARSPMRVRIVLQNPDGLLRPGDEVELTLP